MANRRILLAVILGTALLFVVVGLQTLEALAGAESGTNGGRVIARLEPVKDNSLYEENDSFSNGQGAHLFAGSTANGHGRRALIKFDIAGALPANALILSATLQLYVSKHPFMPSPEPFALHRVTADWGEGMSDAAGEEGTGTAAAVDDATWSFSFYSPTPTERISWTNPGGDFLPEASASTVVDLEGQHYSWGLSTGMIADLEHWLAVPGENHGWLVIGNEADDQTARRFDSRENDIVANRPALFVEYLVVQDRQYIPLMIRD